MQYQAGYILEAVNDQLKAYAKTHNKEYEKYGLLRSLVTFNVQTALNLEVPSNIPAILAVASNIITRGIPTLPSINLEQYFAKSLALTHSVIDEGRGVISFPLSQRNSDSNADEDYYKILHVIEPRANNRRKHSVNPVL